MQPPLVHPPSALGSLGAFLRAALLASRKPSFSSSFPSLPLLATYGHMNFTCAHVIHMGAHAPTCLVGGGKGEGGRQAKPESSGWRGERGAVLLPVMHVRGVLNTPFRPRSCCWPPRPDAPLCAPHTPLPAPPLAHRLSPGWSHSSEPSGSGRPPGSSPPSASRVSPRSLQSPPFVLRTESEQLRSQSGFFWDPIPVRYPCPPIRQLPGYPPLSLSRPCPGVARVASPPCSALTVCPLGLFRSVLVAHGSVQNTTFSTEPPLPHPSSQGDLSLPLLSSQGPFAFSFSYFYLRFVTCAFILESMTFGSSPSPSDQPSTERGLECLSLRNAMCGQEFLGTRNTRAWRSSPEPWSSRVVRRDTGVSTQQSSFEGELYGNRKAEAGAARSDPAFASLQSTQFSFPS